MQDIVFAYKDITKRFFGVRALKEVSFELEKGKILGLIGENGAGKSTLMNIMGGVLKPDEGQMYLKGSPYTPENPLDAACAGIEFIHQELNLFTNLSVAENILINQFPCIRKTPLINKRIMKESCRKLLKSLNLDISPSMLVENLSPGERQLVEIAKALYSDADILLFDEPTTSLTAKETENLFSIMRKLKDEGKSIIYISHILSDVIELVDDIVILRDGQVMGGGPIEDFPVNRMINLMVGREISNVFPERTNSSKKKLVLQTDHVSETGMVRDINLKVHEGEIVGMFGLMGSGRTEFARMLFGVDPYKEGSISIHGETLPKRNPQESIKRGLAFITENRREEGLLMDSPIIENIGLVSLPDYSARVTRLVDSKRLYKRSNEVATSLRLKCNSLKNQKVKSLSGGNQQKVVIGKWLLKDPSLLIMDEPTRGIDVGAKYEVYLIMEHLASEGTGILFISSEIEELMAMCDRIIVWSRGEVMREFEREEFSQENIMRIAFRQELEDASEKRRWQ
ncbi:MAG: sugar ABC transporter ATP-binding protein [Sphaerochaetaceae bacterium]|nr:sugar ABC transporter ATP-binding protein [Sphaerochaetaceae bacterium]